MDYFETFENCFCYKDICTCGEVYKKLDTKTIFEIKQKLEEILFERMQEQQQKMYENFKSKETDL